MPSKISRLTTNFNNKLECNRFIHLDTAPKGGMPESLLENTVYEIRTDDHSHPPISVKLKDLLRIKLSEINSAITWQSHGMELFEYIDWKTAQANSQGALING